MPEIKELNAPQLMPSPQSLARQEVANEVRSLFDEARNMRDSDHDLFRGRSLKDWIDSNVKRFVQFKRRPAHKKPWQSNLASTTPNEKLIGLLSKFATQGMEAKAMSTKSLSTVEIFKERIANNLLTHAAYKNEDDFQIILEMLEALEKGTVIGFEDWYSGRKTERTILDIDQETGELTFKETIVKDWNDVRSTLVNLEDFYPGTLYVRPGCIQDMDYCFLRTLMTEDQFRAEFGKYPDADKVVTQTTRQNESTPFWKHSEDVPDDLIEVIRYFNKKTDEYVILAEDIWINAKGKDTVSPLPWNHKKLPFWAGVGEPLDANFFYGRSIIDKLISDVDAKDALFDRILDQATLSVSRPIIADGSVSSAMTKGFLQPNNVITTDWSQGRPKFDVVPIPEPSAASVNLYQLLQNRNEQSTVTSENIGGRSTKQKTATEVEAQMAGAQELTSLMLKFMEKAIRDKNKLRFANQLQFYTLPSNQNEEGIFRQIVLKDQNLNDGRQGRLQISIRPDPSQERVLQQGQGLTEPIEIMEIPPSLIRDMDMEIHIVPQSSVKMTEAQRRILEQNYQGVMTSLYPDKFNRDYGFEEMNRVFGKDPAKAKAIQQVQPGMEGVPQGMTQGMPQPVQAPIL